MVSGVRPPNLRSTTCDESNGCCIFHLTLMEIALVMYVRHVTFMGTIPERHTRESLFTNAERREHGQSSPRALWTPSTPSPFVLIVCIWISHCFSRFHVGFQGNFSKKKSISEKFWFDTFDIALERGRFKSANLGFSVCFERLRDR